MLDINSDNTSPVTLSENEACFQVKIGYNPPNPSIFPVSGTPYHRKSP